jgi:hypothetical protein
MVKIFQNISILLYSALSLIYFFPPFIPFVFLSVLRFSDFHMYLFSFPIFSSLSPPILLSSHFFKSDLLSLRDGISHIARLLLGPHIQHSKIKLDAYADLFLFVEGNNLVRNVKFYFTVCVIFKFSHYFRTLNRFVRNI